MGRQDLPMGEDDAWLDRALKLAPPAVAGAALGARILADFDAVAERRRLGPAGLAGRIFAEIGAALWPGAPAWQPAVALALSLALGIAAGTFVPVSEASAENGEQAAAVALDQPPAFEIDETS